MPQLLAGSRCKLTGSVGMSDNKTFILRMWLMTPYGDAMYMHN